MINSPKKWVSRLRVCLLFVAIWGLVAGTPNSLQGQDAAPAAAAPAAAAPAAPGAPATEEAPAETSTLVWLIHTSGWIGGVLLLMSFYFVTVSVQIHRDFKPELIHPQGLMDDLDGLLAARDYPGILRTAKESQCELGELVAAGISSLSNGLSEARESIDRISEGITVEMEKRISMLAVIGSLGPLIGLLGTLKGMIASFSVIAKGESQLKASEVAGGISEALLITFEGVALSVPAIFLFAVFKNRLASLGLKAANMADEFLMRVHSSARAKPAAPAAPGPQG